MTGFTLNTNMTLQQVQETFSEAFPYLKLEFFVEPHKQGEGSARSQMVPKQWDAELLVKDIKELTELIELPIISTDTVAQFEMALEENFGLHAQVFRKSGNTWLETTRTDSDTLKFQNARGAAHEPGAQPHENPYQVD